jgi:hypothetical protein
MQLGPDTRPVVIWDESPCIFVVSVNLSVCLSEHSKSRTLLLVTGDVASAQFIATLRLQQSLLPAAEASASLQTRQAATSSRRRQPPLALCASSAALRLSGCFLRYDIWSNVVPAAAATFMQGLVASSSRYAAALGANFSALLADRYQLSASSPTPSG